MSYRHSRGGVGGGVLLQVPIKIRTDKQNNVFKASTSCFTSGMIRWKVIGLCMHLIGQLGITSARVEPTSALSFLAGAPRAPPAPCCTYSNSLMFLLSSRLHCGSSGIRFRLCWTFTVITIRRERLEEWNKIYCERKSVWWLDPDDPTCHCGIPAVAGRDGTPWNPDAGDLDGGLDGALSDSGEAEIGRRLVAHMRAWKREWQWGLRYNVMM